jgi:hypothetical protein
MTASQPLALTGLRGDHPLGFLAACGLLLLLSCEESAELGETRLAWTRSETTGSFIAALYAGQTLDIAWLSKVINQRCAATRESPAFKWSTKIDDRRKYRDAAHPILAQNNVSPRDREALDVFASLASDLITTDKGSLQSTLLDLTSGNQRFLKSILELSKPFTEDAVREAVLGPWQYSDDHHSLGWDPQTQRLHALRNKLPEKDKSSRSVRAAVFLAVQSLRLFPCFVRGGKLHTTGFYTNDNEDWFSWPIWRAPASLDTLRSLLVHPFSADLKKRGVYTIYRCRRIRTGGAEGNYQVFSHASERSWPNSRARVGVVSRRIV